MKGVKCVKFNPPDNAKQYLIDHYGKVNCKIIMADLNEKFGISVTQNTIHNYCHGIGLKYDKSVGIALAHKYPLWSDEELLFVKEHATTCTSGKELTKDLNDKFGNNRSVKAVKTKVEHFGLKLDGVWKSRSELKKKVAECCINNSRTMTQADIMRKFGISKDYIIRVIKDYHIDWVKCQKHPAHNNLPEGAITLQKNGLLKFECIKKNGKQVETGRYFAIIDGKDYPISKYCYSACRWFGFNHNNEILKAGVALYESREAICNFLGISHQALANSLTNKQK